MAIKLNGDKVIYVNQTLELDGDNNVHKIEAHLTLTSNHDAGVTDDSGTLIIGNAGDYSLAFDKNEIQSRYNNTAMSMDFNPHGGNVNFGGGVNVAANSHIFGNQTVAGNINSTGNIYNTGSIKAFVNDHNENGGAPGASVPVIIASRTAWAAANSINDISDSDTDGNPEIVKFVDTVDMSSGGGATPKKLINNGIYFPVAGMYRFTMTYYFREHNQSHHYNCAGWVKLHKTVTASEVETKTKGKVISFMNSGAEASSHSNDSMHTVSNIVYLDPVNDSDNFGISAGSPQHAWLWIDLERSQGTRHIKVQSVSIELIAPEPYTKFNQSSDTYYGG